MLSEGLRRSEQALAVIRATPTAKYQLPMRTAFVGQVRMAAGDIEGALTLFADALDARAGQWRAVLCRRDPAPDRPGIAGAARCPIGPELNAVSSRRLRSRAVRRRSSGSCAQPRHLPGFGPAKGDRPKRCRWWLRSMAGSPRGSIRSN